MSEAVSCGGVVIFRGKVLVLYKNFMNSRDGWVLPKGTVEKGETYEQTAVREVNEEAGADVRIRAYIGSTNYSFKAGHKNIDKIVHWYLCESDSYDCVPQKEEFFTMQVTISITRRIIFWNIRMRNRYFQMLIQCIDN
jgi:8-oxo-dGTP pyrophosphatase MutT (NUDIX family)